MLDYARTPSLRIETGMGAAAFTQHALHRHSRKLNEMCLLYTPCVRCPTSPRALVYPGALCAVRVVARRRWRLTSRTQTSSS